MRPENILPTSFVLFCLVFQYLSSSLLLLILASFILFFSCCLINLNLFWKSGTHPTSVWLKWNSHCSPSRTTSKSFVLESPLVLNVSGDKLFFIKRYWYIPLASNSWTPLWKEFSNDLHSPPSYLSYSNSGKSLPNLWE